MNLMNFEMLLGENGHGRYGTTVAYLFSAVRIQISGPAGVWQCRSPRIRPTSWKLSCLLCLSPHPFKGFQRLSKAFKDFHCLTLFDSLRLFTAESSDARLQHDELTLVLHLRVRGGCERPRQRWRALRPSPLPSHPSVQRLHGQANGLGPYQGVF